MIMYADDGIVYSDEPFTEESIQDHFEGFGIEIAREKSKWIRREGT